MTASEASRSLRGFVVALTVVVIAVLGHVAAGGVAHLQSPIFPVFVVCAIPIAVVLSAREWTLLRLVAFLGISQIAIHLALTMRLFPVQPLTAPVSATDVTSGGMVMSHSMAMGSAAGTHMLVMHSLAVVISALLLRRGEAWLLGLFELALRALGVRALTYSRPAVLPTAFTTVTASRLRSVWSVPPLFTRRGPPVEFAAA